MYTKEYRTVHKELVQKFVFDFAWKKKRSKFIKSNELPYGGFWNKYKSTKMLLKIWFICIGPNHNIHYLKVLTKMISNKGNTWLWENREGSVLPRVFYCVFRHGGNRLHGRQTFTGGSIYKTGWCGGRRGFFSGSCREDQQRNATLVQQNNFKKS